MIRDVFVKGCGSHVSSCPRNQRIMNSSTLVSSTSSSLSSSARIPFTSPLLQEVFPRLQERYKELCNADGYFPLLTKSQEDTLRARTIQRSSPERHSSENNEKKAAVLVLLCSVSGIPSLIVTRRANKLNAHASEMALPGGHYDPLVDTNLVDTALREAYEELRPTHGINNNSHKNSAISSLPIEVYGQATPLPSLHGTPVTPILAIWTSEINRLERYNAHSFAENSTSTPVIPTTTTLEDYFSGNPDEVDCVVAVSLWDMVQKETTRDFPDSRLQRSPVFPTPEGDIWGLTAYILRPLLRKLFQPVFDIPARSSILSHSTGERIGST